MADRRGSLIAAFMLTMILASPAALFGQDAYITTMIVMMVPASIIMHVASKN